MTLRDVFAGQALIGLVQSLDATTRKKYRRGQATGTEAVLAYTLADAMLEERVKAPPDEPEEAMPDPVNE